MASGHAGAMPRRDISAGLPGRPPGAPWKANTTGEGVVAAALPGSTSAVRAMPSTVIFHGIGAATTGQRRPKRSTASAALRLKRAKRRSMGSPPAEPYPADQDAA